MKLTDYIFPTSVTKYGKNQQSVTETIPSPLSQDINKLIEGFKSGVTNIIPKKQAAQPVQQPIQPTAQPVQTPKPNKIEGYTRGEIDPEFADLIIKSAQENGLNPALLAGQLFQESGINKNVKDNISVMENGKQSRDRGMAQISDYWNPQISDEQAYDPNFAIPFMAKTIKQNLEKTGKLSEAVAAYNVGLGRVGVDPSRPAGIGPKGQQYLSGISQNLDPNLAKELGLIY